ncbi:hypothetical protein [Candidatus Hodarchaeum mangrovi]
MKEENSNFKIESEHQKERNSVKRGEQVSKYMFETLKEMFLTLRSTEFQFARSGLIITIILSIISLFLIFLPGIEVVNGNLRFNLIRVNLFAIPISFIVAFVVIYLWFLLGLKITPIIAHLLVDNKILKFIFTKGDVHYLEFIPEEKRKIAMPHILNKYIALIIAWVSVSAFLMTLIAGLITNNDPGRILNPGGNILEATLLFIIRTIILFILVPLVFTLIYPLSWMLIDAKLKAYQKGTKLNWFVGRKVSSITGGFITIAAVFGLGANVVSEPTFTLLQARAELILGLIFFCITNISLIVILIALFYSIFFQGRFYQEICDSINVGFGITSVTLVDTHGSPLIQNDKVLPKKEKEENNFDSLFSSQKEESV